MSNHAEGLVVHKHPSDFVGAKIAIWLFLFTEILLFGGLFILYAVYRSIHPEEFHTAAFGLDSRLGALNTIILLTSSLTVALSIEALQRENRKLSIFLLSFTIACGLGFMVVKYFEWSHKIHLGIFPGSEKLLSTYSNGEILFYNLYYAMTGLHGLHVLVGMGVLSGVLYFIVRKPRVQEQMDYRILERLRGGSHLAVVSDNGNEIGKIVDIAENAEYVDITITLDPASERVNPRNVSKLENSGLYWHLVDIIWIFLFPLFYLIT